MSLKTWIAEFAPVYAYDVKPEDAVDHAILKYNGLSKDNLKKHGVVLDVGKVFDPDRKNGPMFSIAEECALCNIYADFAERRRNCQDCPITLANNGVGCDTVTDGTTESLWRRFVDANDPSIMMDALIKAKAYEESQNDK